jgi:acetyl-CoA carboxylase biotin carboxyl carrier protein
MKENLPAILTDGADAKLLCAPAVGRISAAPPVGTFLGPGAAMGEIRILRRLYRLVVPDGVSGIVSEALVTPPQAVEYRQPLLIVSRAGALPGGEAGPAATAEAGAGEEIPEGMTAVRAPTDGIFYRRPSPDEPAYVEEGEMVVHGHVLGLVEVMKCFNQIACEIDAKIAKILVGDAAEVKSGQPLFLLDPS